MITMPTGFLAFTNGGVFDEGFVEGSCFGNADVLVDECFENQFGTEELLHLPANVFVQVLPTVVHSGQGSNDHVRLVGISNCRDNLKQLVESKQREVATAVDRNEHGVGDCQPVEGCGSHRWRCVYDNNIEVSENWAELPSEKQLAVDLLGLKKIVRLYVNRVGQESQTRARF